jgi:hypothetical protein
MDKLELGSCMNLLLDSGSWQWAAIEYPAEWEIAVARQAAEGDLGLGSSSFAVLLPVCFGERLLELCFGMHLLQDCFAWYSVDEECSDIHDRCSLGSVCSLQRGGVEVWEQRLTRNNG